MAASPTWKVYNAQSEYVGSAKYPELCAAMIVSLGDGATIRYGHQFIAWTEGKEKTPANESFDNVAEVCYTRIKRTYHN